MFLQQGGGSLNLGSVQLAQSSSVQPGTALTMQGLVVPAGILQGNLASAHTGTQHSVTQQSQPGQPQQQSILREQSGTHAQVRHHTHEAMAFKFQLVIEVSSMACPRHQTNIRFQRWVPIYYFFKVIHTQTCLYLNWCNWIRIHLIQESLQGLQKSVCPMPWRLRVWIPKTPHCWLHDWESSEQK